MPTKTGNGGHGQENYDPATGQYVGKENKFLQEALNLSNQEIADEDLKNKYNLTNDDIENNRKIDQARFDNIKNAKSLKEQKVYDSIVDSEGDELYNFFKSKEPQITQNIVSICEKLGGKMYGLDQRIKSLSSIKDKINRNIKIYGMGIDDIKKDFGDGIRYTAIFNTAEFSDSVKRLLSEIQQNGYTIKKLKNRFLDHNGNPSTKYRDVISTLVSPEGIEFELQFNTVSGICAKNGKEYKNGEFVDKEDGSKGSHFYYAERRDIPKEEEEGLRARYLDYMMEKIWTGVPIPLNINKINN